MTLFRKLVISAATAATLIGATAPAAAQGWGRGYGRGYGGGWHHRGGGDVGGALVGGLIIGGLFGALAASSRDRDYDRDPGPTAKDRAADACAIAVEDDRRANVRQVTRVDWFDEGWHVEGIIDGGDPDGPNLGRPDSFSCSYRYGKVDDIRYGSDYRPRG